MHDLKNLLDIYVCTISIFDPKMRISVCTASMQIILS